jgi:hypothetical protein
MRLYARATAPITFHQTRTQRRIERRLQLKRLAALIAGIAFCIGCWYALSRLLH